MEDCEAIDSKLQMKTVKTLFLCNRQQTKFYLFVTRGDKPFKSKNFSAALGVSRVSFAPEEKMEEMMGNKVGADYNIWSFDGPGTEDSGRHRQRSGR